MLITRANDYAVRTLTYLAAQPKHQQFTTDYLAKELHIPRYFLAKILHKLIKKELIVSVKGKKGGLYLKSPTDQLTVKQVMDIVDGFPVLSKCVYQKNSCFLINSCIMNSILIRIQTKVEKEFSQITVSDLVPNKK